MPVQTRRRPPSLKPPVAPFAPTPVADPVVPAGKSKVSKAGKRVRRKDPTWARVVVIMGAVLMMVSGGAIVGSKVLIGQATGSIEQDNLLGTAGKSDAEGGSSLDGPIDLLLLGVDARARLDVNDVRADTIIVLHIPATHDQAYLISIPRDTEAHIPASPKGNWGGGTDKINAAFFHGAQNGGGWAGGAQLMARTIKELTGVGFDGAAIIDFNGFKGVIDALGTIPMCVTQEVESAHMTLVDGKPHWNADARKMSGEKTKVVHKVGCRQMKGWEALDFSRQRYGLANGDYDRQQNQQKLIKGMAKKAMDGGVMGNPLKLRQLMEAAGKAFVLDTGGTPVADFVFTMRGVTTNELVLLRTNNGTFSSNGAGKEQLQPISQEMFRAVKNDALAEFVINNPTVLSGQK
ncbi:LCP family protein [Micromonospora sp. NPDC049679]|uniref:LCP family protein n=1 Tax=Micromonospora sp. NPDC049679 TaxID=3155920 RepID=UPI0033CF2F30